MTIKSAEQSTGVTKKRKKMNSLKFVFRKIFSIPALVIVRLKDPGDPFFLVETETTDENGDVNDEI